MCSIESSSSGTTDPSPDFASLSSEQLTGEITELAAHINAASCRWLLLVGEFDRREVWADWGCVSCAGWLSYRCGLSPAAGREQVRVARALEELPVVRAAFSRGELCYSQVRALTRIASPETEDDLLMVARHATAGQLEVIVRAYRGLLADRDPGRPRRFVRLDHDEDGSLLVQARLPAEEGAVLAAALAAGRDAIRAGRVPHPGGAEERSAADVATGSVSAETTQIGDSSAESETETGSRTAASNADALMLMAETLLASGPAERSGGDSYQVVVHVDTAALARQPDDEDQDHPGPCQLDQGPALHPETARRLACDASVVRILERDGRPLSVGRKTRTIPPALRRALRVRDPVCRFPGCNQRRFLHAHHVRHWAHGGATDLSNLIQLCSHHHRLVHEGGYTIQAGAGGAVRFKHPDGRTLPQTLPRLSGHHQELARSNIERGLALTDETAPPIIYGDRLDLHAVVDDIAETDPRLALQAFP
jgi:hypothetical protein